MFQKFACKNTSSADTAFNNQHKIYANKMRMSNDCSPSKTWELLAPNFG